MSNQHLQQAKIPTDRLMDVIEPILLADDMDMAKLGVRVGVKGDTVYKLLSKPEVNFDLADRILCGLGVPVAWHTHLGDIYDSIELVDVPFPYASEDGSKRCERRGCSVRFTPERRAPKVGPKVRKFCTQHCATVASQNRRGSVPIKMHRAVGVCDAGLHDMTPENTIPGDFRRCRECRRSYQRAWIAAKRRRNLDG